MHASRRRKSTLVLFVMTLLGLGQMAGAQLPPDLYTTSRSLTPEQAASLKKFVEDNLKGLKSTDGKALADARRTLLDPVRRDATSRVFRMAFDDAATAGLSALAKDESAGMANRQAAIWILGAIASDASDATLRDVMLSSAPALRYAAASGFERSMQAIRRERHAYSNALQSEKNVARYLRDPLAGETDAEVLRAMLSAAASLPTVTDSLDALSDGLVAQARRLKDDGDARLLDSLRIGLERMQKRFVVDTVGGAAIAPHEHKMIEAATNALLLVVRHGNNQKITAENRQLYANLARTSENLLSLVTRRDTAQTQVSGAIAAGNDEQAEAELNSTWLAPDGPIYTNRQWQFAPGSIEEEFNR